MAPSCDQCGGPIDQLRPGRVARFCSDYCRVAFHRAVIPEIMRKERRWVTYKSPSLQPLQPDGQPASVTSPETWASYPQVRGRKGKGYALGNNVGCVAFAHCVDPDTGALHPGVAEIVDPLLTKTYIEVSPWGDGLHVFGVVNDDEGWVRHFAGGLGIELCSRDRFVPVTGNRYSRCSQLGFIRQHFDRLAPIGR
ncbi:hypothetical protein [Mycobacterium seoulense]|uniref:hypothetical protein n=1 Tax=Mycobacterium seoulense TaxID=386911 RepID=UPI003CF9291B